MHRVRKNGTRFTNFKEKKRYYYDYSYNLRFYLGLCGKKIKLRIHAED